jgi:hypothetical protein
LGFTPHTDAVVDGATNVTVALAFVTVAFADIPNFVPFTMDVIVVPAGISVPETVTTGPTVE